MTDEDPITKLPMTTDEELIARLRALDTWVETAYVPDLAANRIETLIAERDEQIEWVKRLADDLIAAEAKLAWAEWLLTDAMVHLEEGKIKTRRNRARLIREFLSETKGENK